MLLPENAVRVLDHGFVRFLGTLEYFDGSEHEAQVVSAARASFEKEVTALGKRDIGLINFLLRRVENSPFRHSVLAFEVRAPLMIARQWHRYAVGSAHLVEDDGVAWNEGSRRYVTEEPEFYFPGAWRSAPEDKKQGSGPEVDGAVAEGMDERYHAHLVACREFYADALRAGVCAEQARLVLPAYGLYVRWRWTASLLAVLHFLDERLADKAQGEMVQYAEVVHDLAQPLYPHSFGLIG